MNVAILIISSASLICSAGCLGIMLKGAQEAKGLKTKVETVERKVVRNAQVIKSALGQLEL